MRVREREFIEDTAQISDINVKPSPKTIRNDMFDRIVKNGIVCDVALRSDIVNKFPKRLFYGQVGRIEKVILNDEEKHCYLVIFINYEQDYEEFYRCLVEKENLLPLFCFDPAKYAKSQQGRSISELRDSWEQLKFDVAPKLELARHKKSENQFKLGQLVTIEVDFKQDLSNNESFIIQAGQIGIISEIKENDENVVEVTFRSIPFGLLARIRESFISSNNPLSFATSSWERKISIDKNYLFPLYVGDLDEENLNEENVNVEDLDVENLR